MVREWLIRLASLLVAPLAVGQEALVPNLDFAEGGKGWSAWAEKPAHRWAVDPQAGRGGKPALRIDAVDPRGEVMVMTSTDRLQAGERYQITAWWRTRDLSAEARADMRAICRDADGTWLTGDDLRAFETVSEGEWTRKAYRLSVPERTKGVTLGIWVRETSGTIWVSDLGIRPAPRGQRTFDSMVVYDPEQVALGLAPLTAFRKLKESDSPFLARAKRWNGLLVQVAFWQEDLSRARRLALYRGAAAGAALAAHEQALDTALADLDRLQQTYGRLYVANTPAVLATAFDPVADQLEQAVRAGSAALRQCQATLNPQPASGAWVTIPPAPVDQPWWDAATQRPRYILWNRWSDTLFSDFEEPLNLGDCQTLTAGTPAKTVAGKADWSPYAAQREALDRVGKKRFTLITHYSLHDKGWLAPEFAARHGNDPDLRMWDLEGKPQGPPAGTTMLNWLNPLARGHLIDILTQMAETFRPKPEYQFYVTSWESSGPYIGNARIGENPSHQVAFREYLRQRYGTVAALNQAWGSTYAGFEDLSPVPEAPVPVGDPGTPLLLESQRWAQEAYVDYIRCIRDTLHAVDPAKPVLGEQSGLLATIVSPRVIDSVDILGYHHRARTVMPLQVWLTSLQRTTGRPLALYENFWGCQEDHPQRMGDERAMRAQLRRYLYRHAAWGRCTQTWWYAYTSAPYLTTYNGNWFTPVYDLTTFRYSAAGLPVEKSKVDRFERLLLDSEIVPARLVLVQPYSSMLAQGRNSEVWHEWLDWHHLLFPRNQLYEALPDTWFVEGRCRLADFAAVILPVATHLERGFAAQVVQFLQNGGTVVASGPPGRFDDLGRPDGALLRAATPAVTVTRTSPPSTSWQFDYGVAPGASGWVELSVGKGRLLLAPVPLGRLPDRGQALAAWLRESATPAAEAPGTTFELLLRRLPDGRHLLCALNRDPDRATEGTVAVVGDFTQVADVDQAQAARVPSAVRAGRTEFRLRLDPGETTYLVLAK